MILERFVGFLAMVRLLQSLRWRLQTVAATLAFAHYSLPCVRLMRLLVGIVSAAMTAAWSAAAYDLAHHPTIKCLSRLAGKGGSPAQMHRPLSLPPERSEPVPGQRNRLVARSGTG